MFCCCCYFYVWDYQCWHHLNANIAWMLNNGTPESQLSLNIMQFWIIFTNLKGNIAWKELLQLFICFLIHQMWLWLSTRKESHNEKNLHTYEISMLVLQHRAQCSICFFVSHFFKEARYQIVIPKHRFLHEHIFCSILFHLLVKCCSVCWKGLHRSLQTVY